MKPHIWDHRMGVFTVNGGWVCATWIVHNHSKTYEWSDARKYYNYFFMVGAIVVSLSSSIWFWCLRCIWIDRPTRLQHQHRDLLWSVHGWFRIKRRKGSLNPRPSQWNFAFPYVLNLPFEGRYDIRCLWKTNSLLLKMAHLVPWFAH